MRAALITIQAAILTCIAVLGANSETDAPQACPLPATQPAQYCSE